MTLGPHSFCNLMILELRGLLPRRERRLFIWLKRKHENLFYYPIPTLALLLYFQYFLKDFISLFFDRGEGREKERERNINVWLPLMRPQVGTWPATQACAPTGN